jgi:hypothetical protein
MALEDLDASKMTLEDSPVSSAPYGFWRNETSIFIRTSEWLFMEETEFNYSCKPINPNQKCGTNLNMRDMKTADGMPVLRQCTMLVKIPANIYNFKIEFCQNVMLIHNIETNTIGIKTMNQSCMMKVLEGDIIQNLWISEGSYRFFRQLSFIACSPEGNGVYTNCSNDELILIEALDMGYDEVIKVAAEVGSFGSNGLSIDTSGFSSLLSSKSKNIFLIIGIVVGAVVLATVINYHHLPTLQLLP